MKVFLGYARKHRGSKTGFTMCSRIVLTWLLDRGHDHPAGVDVHSFASDMLETPHQWRGTAQ